MDDLIEFVVIPVTIFVTSFVLLFGVTRQWGHHVDVSECTAFGAASGYETKFVDYNFWDWDCLAKIDNAKWVEARNLRGVNQ